MSSSSPTPQQIATVKTNLHNMQHFNDYACDTAALVIPNAYNLLSQPKSDPGLAIGLDILSAAFSAIGSEGGPIGSFVATFLSGMVATWASNTPPNLTGQFASYTSRLAQAKIAVDEQLAGYKESIQTNWNTQFTFNGKTTTLSDLSTETFPSEGDTKFEDMASQAVLGIQQGLWKQLLATNFVITHWEQGQNITSGTQNAPPVAWVQGFYAAHPAYYETWDWHNSTGCGDQNGWQMHQYNLGTGAGFASDGSISPAACQYLFKDSTPGTIINPHGLFERATVFNNLGINQVTHIVTPGAALAAPKLSTGYLRAMKEGQTLGQLINQEGRASVEARIVKKAQQDSIFANDLTCRPRQTLEEFLGVKIPDVVSLGILVENPRTFGLVVPMPDNNQDKG
jgi:hypothetical protein